MSPSHATASSANQAQDEGHISAFKRHRGAWATRGQLKDELEKLHITRSRTSDAPVWILVTLLAVAAGSATIGALTHKLDAQTAVGLAAAVLTVAGLLVAVLQWRAGLSEKAFDALYGRIKMANDMRIQAFKDMESAKESEVAATRPELYKFFVYTEIDSLEYAARRYRFGLGMNSDIVRRALRHFRARCGSDPFCETALKCTDRTSGYFPETVQMVRSIVNEAMADRPASPQER